MSLVTTNRSNPITTSSESFVVIGLSIQPILTSVIEVRDIRLPERNRSTSPTLPGFLAKTVMVTSGTTVRISDIMPTLTKESVKWLLEKLLFTLVPLGPTTPTPKTLTPRTLTRSPSSLGRQTREPSDTLKVCCEPG